MPPAAKKQCDFPGCDRGQPTADSQPDCYTTPEGFATRELVHAELIEHVGMAHILPTEAVEAEEKRLLVQANLVKAEAEKIRAEQPQEQRTAKKAGSSTTSGPKSEKIP